MRKWIVRFISFVTFHSLRSKWARERYEFLKARICERHFAGFAGLVVHFKGRRFTKTDVACFRAPMYYSVMNQDRHWVIFWDRARMTREIGVGAPLKEGEAMIPDTPGRSKPSSTLETVDEQKPLVVATDAAGDEKNDV